MERKTSSGGAGGGRRGNKQQRRRRSAPAPKSQSRTWPPKQQRNWTGGDVANTIASMLGGAVIGAGVIYLLDPDSGRLRRHVLAETARGAAECGEAALGSAWETASEKMHELKDTLADQSAEATDSAASRARDLLHRAADAPSSWLDSA